MDIFGEAQDELRQEELEAANAEIPAILPATPPAAAPPAAARPAPPVGPESPAPPAIRQLHPPETTPKSSSRSQAPPRHANSKYNQQLTM